MFQDDFFGNYEYETENPANLLDSEPTEVQRFCSLPFFPYTSLFNEFGTCYWLLYSAYFIVTGQYLKSLDYLAKWQEGIQSEPCPVGSCYFCKIYFQQSLGKTNKAHKNAHCVTVLQFYTTIDNLERKSFKFWYDDNAACKTRLWVWY